MGSACDTDGRDDIYIYTHTIVVQKSEEVGRTWHTLKDVIKMNLKKNRILECGLDISDRG
jgi:hypothetical protein